MIATFGRCLSLGMHMHHLSGCTRKLPALICSSRTVDCQIDMVRGMAGHSKWANIKHTKGAKDAQKANNATKITQQLKVAAREGGSADPKFNFRIARILQQGKDMNVAKDTMERALKNIEKAASGQKIYAEAMGSGNYFFIIECVTSSIETCRNELQHYCKKYGARLGPSGTAAHSFELKGMVETSAPEDGSVDLDAATEIAIEAGAEDVKQAISDDNEQVLQYICDVQDLHQVRANLEEMNHDITTSRIQYEAISNKTITNEQMEIARELFDALEALESVTRIYDNIEVKS